MAFSESFFPSRFGIATSDLDRWLAQALSRGGDYADLYFEYVETTSLSLDESIVKSATQGVSLGLGVRVISGERSGYAYCGDFSPEKIDKAARTAACIAAGPASLVRTSLDESPKLDLYPVPVPAAASTLAERVALILEADQAARAADSRVFQVSAGFSDSIKHILIATSDGGLVWDRQPMARLNVTVLARAADGRVESGYQGGGGRAGLDHFTSQGLARRYACEAVRQALVQLDAGEAPAGEMTVVLGPGWPGILLHEAVGHGLEADFNRKQVSAFSGRVGQQVASPLCTVVDDGAMAGRRGSLNVDDEGTPSRQNVLIENGILRGYLQDRLSSRLLGAGRTGNGRRESYQHMPLPRMTNTYLLPGQSDPSEIIGSVKSGLYCATFGGGQVDITSGNFVFSATESYLIEGGRLTRPVRGATLIGNGPDAMQRVTMVGNDLKLDEGVGICGKEGQSVPVGVGIPTVKLDGITVGGRA
ncbi:MAG: metalloprotease TldD [Acidobacteria bacterium]|nr:metalloprotease TldD [Acidobacteriota bacterium]